jgi:hypothetical protein
VLWTAGVSLLAVLWMTFVMPIGDVFDETEHAFRAYQLSLGHLYPQFFSCVAHPTARACSAETGPLVPLKRVGGQVSTALYVVLHKLFRIGLTGQRTHFDPSTYASFAKLALGGSSTVFAHFENTVLYSPVNYIPQTTAFWFGRLFSAGVLRTLFTARLAAGLVWMALVTTSVALMRRWRWLWAMAVLVPTALAQGPSLSADSMAFGIVAVAVAYALRLAHAGEPLRWSQIARLTALGLALGLLKFPFPLVIVAIAVIVWPLCGGGRMRWGALAAFVLPGLAAAAWWNVTIDAYFLAYRNTVFKLSLRRDINRHAQVHYILSHLIKMPALLWNTLTSGQLIRLGELVGTYGERALPAWLGGIWLIVLVALATTCTEAGRPSRGTRAGLGLVLVLGGLVTVFTLYATWNGVGASSIDGVQGRYFSALLVLAVPLLAGLARIRPRVPEWLVPVTVMTVTGTGAIIIFESTAWSYYHQALWQVAPRVVRQLF